MINWFTVAAQIVNFLILVALLKRFLYKPIVDAMNKRQETIETALSEAEKKRRAADDQAEEYRKKSAEIDRRRDDMLKEGRDKAEEERKQLVEKARKEADGLKQKWQSAVREEQDAFLEALRSQMVEQTMTLAGKALADMADSELEDRMLAAFGKQLAGLDDDDLEQLKAAVKEADGKGTVKSSFKMTKAQTAALQSLIGKKLGVSVQIEAEQSRHLTCGIQFTAAGRKLAWTVDDYLERAREAVAETLHEGLAEKEGPGGAEENS